MAITINGDGTLTGISTGGLPDGIVDADTLATNAVTAAKLKSDAIASGDLPTGSILQVQVAEKTANQEVNSSTHVDIMSVTITPTSSSNPILLLTIGGTIITNASGRLLRTTFFRGTTNLASDDTSTTKYLTEYKGSSSELLLPHCTFHYDDAHSSSSELTYKYKALSSGGGVWVNNVGSVRISKITLMAIEVAA